LLSLITYNQIPRNHLHDSSWCAQNEEADPLQKEAVRSRCETIHTLTLCEMNHFHEQRRQDFRDMAQEYFDSQMKFHLAVRLPTAPSCRLRNIFPATIPHPLPPHS